MEAGGEPAPAAGARHLCRPQSNTRVMREVAAAKEVTGES